MFIQSSIGKQTGSLGRALRTGCAAIALSVACISAHAQSSELSMISALPVASVAYAGASVVTAGASLVVRSVEVSGNVTVLVLERVTDGVRSSVRISGRVAERASIVAGTALSVATVASGTMLIASGEVIAFVPNELGRALLHNEPLTW